MGKRKIMILLFSMALLVLSCVVDAKAEATKTLSEVNRKLKLLNKPALKSIKSADGDTIDCIDIYKQPAFEHPALRNHTIQMTPSYDPSETKTKSKWDHEVSSVTVTSQLWQKSGSCPKGTIPIRRIRRSDQFKAGNSVENYGRKKPSFLHQVAQLNGSQNSNLLQMNHSKAILVTDGYRYLGAKGDIKVWNPYVESDDEYSTSQVRLLSGPNHDFESIEAGWAVNPSIYGDRQSRLFAYWTADASKTTGCFDLTCPGFVQTSHIIALGAAVHPISLLDQLPYQITIYIFKDPRTGNWWLQYGDGINIGYWPPELFRALSYQAVAVEWGGEVYSSKLGHAPHTATAMGNGNFPDPNWGNSGWIKRMRIHDNSAALKFPDWVETYKDEYNCYDAYYVSDYVEDPEFYFGGPGKNFICP
ncbi:hypothetical protein F2P56_012264 [Juglans regia]|uniref:Uncharacterized protein LOC109014539 n=2 Tax=Juglans regia TaxID=51240 RepID=A0A2I4H8W4_JUGRE|nr:uncharacterized protein LOC109014539 [Juglans regia]KAF5468083.1 hypothetical protein F2P56_012264 [Juglans regia]